MYDQLLNAIDTQALTIGKVAGALAILLGFYIVARVERKKVTRWLAASDSVDEALAATICRLTSWVIILGGVILSLTVLGILAGPIVLFVGIIGVMAAVSGKGLLENVTAGLSLQL